MHVEEQRCYIVWYADINTWRRSMERLYKGIGKRDSESRFGAAIQTRDSNPRFKSASRTLGKTKMPDPQTRHFVVVERKTKIELSIFHIDYHYFTIPNIAT